VPKSSLVARFLRNAALIAAGFAVQFVIMVGYSKVWGWLDPHAKSWPSLMVQHLGPWQWLVDEMFVLCLSIGAVLPIRRRWPGAVRFLIIGVTIGFIFAADYYLTVDPESSIFAGDYR